MKKIIIFALKMRSLILFNSHWCAFARMNTLIGGGSSTDQLAMFVPTVFRNFNFSSTPTQTPEVRVFFEFCVDVGWPPEGAMCRVCDLCLYNSVVC